MKKSSITNKLPKKTVVIISVILISAGIICYIISFKRNHLISDITVAELSGVLMIAGILLLAMNLKKADETESNDSQAYSESEYYLKRLADMKQKFYEMTYGDEDEGMEEISITSEKLGKFIYRRKPEWYEAECEWCGTPISVFLEVYDISSPEEVLKKIENIFSMQNEIDTNLRIKAEQLLDQIKEKNKCPEEISDIKSRDFAERIMPSSLDTASVQKFLLYYDDDIDNSDCRIIAHLSADGTISHVELDDGT